jgi:hypothetical protein
MAIPPQCLQWMFPGNESSASVARWLTFHSCTFNCTHSLNWTRSVESYGLGADPRRPPPATPLQLLRDDTAHVLTQSLHSNDCTYRDTFSIVACGHYLATAVSPAPHFLLWTNSNNINSFRGEPAINGPVVSASDDGWVWSIVWNASWQVKPRTRRKPAAMFLSSPQISHDLTWDWNRSATVGGQLLAVGIIIRTNFLV